MTLTDWKDDPDGVPIVELYSIAVDDVTTLRYVAGDPHGTGSVEYDGETYTAIQIEREEIREGIEGDLPSCRLAISNVNGIAGGYIEREDLEGRPVTYIATPLDLLSSVDPNDRIEMSFKIQQQAYNRKAASFSLGHPDFTRRRVPWRRFQRTRCQHDYSNRFIVGNRCGYPSDEFSAASAQDLVLGATADTLRAREHGWSVLNSTKANRGMNVHDDQLDACWIGITNTTNRQWANADRLGPAMVKVVDGDFDIYTKLAVPDTRNGVVTGLLCQGNDSAQQDSWIIFGYSRFSSLIERRRRLCNNDSSGDVQATHDFTTHPYIRMARAGDTFSLYYSDEEDADWQLYRTDTLALDSDVRVGLVLSVNTGESADVTAVYDYFRFKAGGLPDCDFTLDGPNGCRLHGNTRHFGATPGIPRR